MHSVWRGQVVFVSVEIHTKDFDGLGVESNSSLVHSNARALDTTHRQALCKYNKHHHQSGQTSIISNYIAIYKAACSQRRKMKCAHKAFLISSPWSQL